MSDHLIASDLSYLVLQKRRRESELTTPALDSSNQALYPLPCALVQREAFMASSPRGISEDEWIKRQQRIAEQG